MFPVPISVFLTRGVGVHRDQLTAFEFALRAPGFAAVKGIIHEPGTRPTMKPESRDALLTAIAKAGGWTILIFLSRRDVANAISGHWLCHMFKLIAKCAFKLIAKCAALTAEPVVLPDVGRQRMSPP